MCEARIHVVKFSENGSCRHYYQPSKEAHRRYDAEGGRAQSRNVCRVGLLIASWCFIPLNPY